VTATPARGSSSFIPLVLATALGAGYAPIAPGTWGSAVGLLLWFALPSSVWIQALAIVAVAVAGVWSGGVAERHFGRTDPGEVVIDEVAGMLVTLFLNPVSWWGAVAGFLLFRAADIVKPFPARRLEGLHGGFGIMADDVMAGIYANLALRLCIWLFGHLVIWSFILFNPNAQIIR
jgi:phosphatidylglycerophosphatase A